MSEHFAMSRSTVERFFPSVADLQHFARIKNKKTWGVVSNGHTLKLDEASQGWKLECSLEKMLGCLQQKLLQGEKEERENTFLLYGFDVGKGNKVTCEPWFVGEDELNISLCFLSKLPERFSPLH